MIVVSILCKNPSVIFLCFILTKLLRFRASDFQSFVSVLCSKRKRKIAKMEEIYLLLNMSYDGLF